MAECRGSIIGTDKISRLSRRLVRSAGGNYYICLKLFGWERANSNSVFLFARDDLEGIQQDMLANESQKTLEEVTEYSAVFWKRYKELESEYWLLRFVFLF